MKAQFERVTHARFFVCGFRLLLDHLGEPQPYPHRRFRHRFRNWCRHPRTMQERRRNVGEHHDRDYHARGRRMKLPSDYDDIPAYRTSGKSWKDFTRYEKQWMQNLD